LHGEKRVKHRRGIDLTVGGNFAPIGSASELQWMSFEKLSQYYVLGARCSACGRTNLLDRWELERRFGRATFLEDLRPRLRCVHCKEKGKSDFIIGKMDRNA